MKNAEVLSENNKMDGDKYLGEKEKAGSASQLWKCHKCIDCNVCKLCTGQMRKGRAKKISKRGRPKKETPISKNDGYVFDHLCTLWEISSDYEINSSKIPSELLNTYICQNLLRYVFSAISENNMSPLLLCLLFVKLLQT